MRYANPEDFPAIAELDGASFGFHYSPEDLEDALLDVEPTRFLVEEQGSTLVGLTTDIPFRMTVPGGGDVPVAGITWVSVEVTHRRRGILRRLVERQLRDRAADGFAAAVLTASQGSIYGRFGFGVAEYTAHCLVERRTARLREPVAPDRVERRTTESARDELPDLYDRWRRLVPGALDRSATRWRCELLDRESRRGGASGLFHLVHPDGYASYRILEKWQDELAAHVLRLVDYAPVTAEAHAALWQTMLSMELVGTIETQRVATDDPLRHLLVEPRALRTTAIGDGLWVRPLDVEALLSSRTYALDLDVVLEVRDGLLGDASYRLRGGPDGATCTRTDRPADLAVPVGVLGAVVLGGVRLAELARAGRVHRTGRAAGTASDALTRLDRALLADRAPQHGTRF